MSLPPDCYNPEAVVAEMIRLARPGGVIAVEEPDAWGWVCDPPHPAFDIPRQCVVEALRRDGKDFHLGRRAGRLLRDAGLRAVKIL